MTVEQAEFAQQQLGSGKWANKGRVAWAYRLTKACEGATGGRDDAKRGQLETLIVARLSSKVVSVRHHLCRAPQTCLPLRRLFSMSQEATQKLREARGKGDLASTLKDFGGTGFFVENQARPPCPPTLAPVASFFVRAYPDPLALWNGRASIPLSQPSHPTLSFGIPVVSITCQRMPQKS